MTKRKTIVTFEPDAPVRQVVGFEGLYSVTDDGRIWSHAKAMGVSRHGGRWLRPAINRSGYAFVCMTKDKARTLHRVHRVVAAAWVTDPNPTNGRRDVNHVNGAKQDNRAANLQWCTSSENNAHAWRSGLRTHPARQIHNHA